MIKLKTFDVIIAGAGSVGVPAAAALCDLGLKTLILDMHPSPGQGENKHAIGGVRASHSEPGKILTCRRSIEIYSTWHEQYGEDIEWRNGGYLFPVFRKKDESVLRSLLPLQKEFGLKIDFVDAEEIKAIVPGINSKGLRGGTYSPKDGSISPLRSIHAFYRRATGLGATFHFKEEIKKILIKSGKVTGVSTDKGKYAAPVVIDAAGPFSAKLCKTINAPVRVIPESHEAAITEPVHPFFHCMLVDIRPSRGSNNFYFYQNRHGQIIFCLTPDPPMVGTEKGETSVFLPLACKRLIRVLPRLKNIRVRRMWRGLYPMTPDGSPIVGWNRNLKGLLHATGMCGQGLMLAPGLAEVIARMVYGQTTKTDKTILEAFSPQRKFKDQEALK